MDLLKKTCVQLFDLVETGQIMLKLDDEYICFDKQDFLANINSKENLFLLGKVLEYMKQYKAVNLWILVKNKEGEYDLTDTQKTILLDKSRISNNVTRYKHDICRQVNSKSGREVFPYRNEQFIVKIDNDYASLNKEKELYTKLINSTVQSTILPHFSMLVSAGKCDNDKPWLAYEFTGENFFKYLKNNNIPINISLVYITQIFIAYLYLVKNNYTHGDFKPQNAVIADTPIENISYADPQIVLPTYGKMVKLIDFGDTVPNRKTIMLKDMNRFFTLLAEITNLTEFSEYMLAYINEVSHDCKVVDCVYKILHKLLEILYKL